MRNYLRLTGLLLGLSGFLSFTETAMAQQATYTITGVARDADPRRVDVGPLAEGLDERDVVLELDLAELHVVEVLEGLAAAGHAPVVADGDEEAQLGQGLVAVGHEVPVADALGARSAVDRQDQRVLAVRNLGRRAEVDDVEQALAAREPVLVQERRAGVKTAVSETSFELVGRAPPRKCGAKVLSSLTQ